MTHAHTNDPDGFETFVDLLRSRSTNDQLAIQFLPDGETPGPSLTYSELDRRSQAIAATLQESIRPGDRVLILMEPGLDFVTAFTGCLYAQAVAVPAYPPRDNKYLNRVLAIIQDAQAAVILTSSFVLKSMSDRAPQAEAALKTLRVIAVDQITESKATQWRPANILRQDLAFLQYTSGSTGNPKGVMLTHGNIMANMTMIRDAMKFSTYSVMVSWLPVYHDMGLIGGVLQPLYVGCTTILMPPAAFLEKPVRWLKAITRYRATHTGAPNFAYDLCVRRVKPEDLENLDLSSLQVLYNGAEPIRKDTLDGFIRTFSVARFNPNAFFPCYGLAEATLFVSGGPHLNGVRVLKIDHDQFDQGQITPIDSTTPTRNHVKTLVSSGAPSDHLLLSIADPESGRALSESQVGEIWLSAPSIASGYWNKPSDTEECFRASLDQLTETQYLRTGDLGFIRQGQLFVTGRIKDLIIIAGKNHYPQDIELTAERSHPAIRSGCIVAYSTEGHRSERVTIVAEIERTQLGTDLPNVAHSIKQAVLENHEISVDRVYLLKPTRLPKTSSGKVQRRLTRKLIDSHELETLYLSDQAPPLTSMTPVNKQSPAKTATSTSFNLQSELDTIISNLSKWLALSLELSVEEIRADAPLSQYGIDSLAVFELINQVEEQYGVRISASTLSQSPTLLSVAETIQRLKKA